MPPSNKKKFLSFIVLSNLIVLLMVELSAYFCLKLFYTPNILAGENGEYDLQLDVNPFMEFNKVFFRFALGFAVAGDGV